MQTKLTLSMDKSIIARAKKYARARNKSLSQIIEDYLKIIAGNENTNSMPDSLPPVTRSLAGILKGKKEIDFRSSVAGYLEKKYK